MRKALVMHVEACDRQQWRERVMRGVSLGLTLACAAALGGCAAGARPDVDLNRGEILEAQETEETAALGVEDVFPQLGVAPDDGGYVYRVREGDQLEVVFFSHPEQNRFVRVRPDGRITMPFLGELGAAGKTATDLAKEIQSGYQEVLVTPRVDVIVQEPGGQFYVLGQVRRPGQFEFERPIGLIQALAAAGGYDDKARLSNIVVLRLDGAGRTWAGIFDFRDFMDTENRIGNIAIRPDDIVWVPKSAIARWNDASAQSLGTILDAQEVIIDTWSLARFDDVFTRRF